MSQASAADAALSPILSPLQSSTSRAWLASNSPKVPDVCFVTGGTGFVGQRLVEMLVERGAKKVVSFDIVPPPKDAWQHPNIEWVVGDITKPEQVHACSVFLFPVNYNRIASVLSIAALQRQPQPPHSSNFKPLTRTSRVQVQAAMRGAQCVWHNAAAVGPFHPRDLCAPTPRINTAVAC